MQRWQFRLIYTGSDKAFKRIFVNRALKIFAWRVTWEYAYSPFNAYLSGVHDGINREQKTIKNVPSMLDKFHQF